MLGGRVCGIVLAVLLKDIHCPPGNHILKKCIFPLTFLEGVTSASYLHLSELSSSERNYFIARDNFHKLGVSCVFMYMYTYILECAWAPVPGVDVGVHV